MSRREDRSSEAKHHRSRFDREPSPKRSRRDGGAGIELERDRLDRDHKSGRVIRDPLPLEAPSRHDSKAESGTRSKQFENRIDRHHGGTRPSADPSKLPRSRSYFEHDDRGSVGKLGRSFGHRVEKERGWWRDPKEAINKAPSSDSHHKNGTGKDSNDVNRPWRHDGYSEMEASHKPPVSKRPAFREQKIPANDKTNKAAADPRMSNPQHHSMETSKGDDRSHTSRNSGKLDQQDLIKAKDWRGSFTSRDRSDPRSGYRGRERFTPREGYHPHGGRVDRWKHDLYDEANKSPSPVKDEDQLSKIEALLAS